MKSFGEALRTLRGGRTGIEVAAVALGEESTKEERRDFANYLSRIERDKVPSVGLDRIKLIATGLGLMPLSRFHRAIELAQESDEVGQSGSQNSPLKTHKASGKTTLKSDPIGVSRDQNAPVFADDTDRARLRFEIIHEIASLLFAATSHTPRQITAPDAARSGSRSTVRSSSR